MWHASEHQRRYGAIWRILAPFVFHYKWITDLWHITPSSCEWRGHHHFISPEGPNYVSSPFGFKQMTAQGMYLTLQADVSSGPGLSKAPSSFGAISIKLNWIELNWIEFNGICECTLWRHREGLYAAQSMGLGELHHRTLPQLTTGSSTLTGAPPWPLTPEPAQ